MLISDEESSSEQEEDADDKDGQYYENQEIEDCEQGNYQGN